MAGINPATGQFDPYYYGGGAYTGPNTTEVIPPFFSGMATDYSGAANLQNYGPGGSAPIPVGGSTPVTGEDPNRNQGTITPTVSGGVTVPPAAFSAIQMLENLLRTATGIEGLGKWAADLYNRGATATEIVQALRYGTDTSEAGKAARNAYLQAFPKMDIFLKNGQFAGESPELQYIEYRNTVRDAAERYGVNSSLVTNDRIADYIEGDKSAAELVARMSNAATAIATTPVETLAYLESEYGVRNNDLMSLYLDTDLTEAELTKRYTAATIGGDAARQRFGIDRSYAEELAQRGVTDAVAQKAFQTAAGQRSFMYGRGDTIEESGLVRGQFGDVSAAQAIARVAAARQARFAGGGSFATDKTGVAALGSSQ